MEPDERDAERLNEALDLAGRGGALAASAAGAPELGPLLAVADRLTRAARAEPGVPRPTFVLGLEEQLRTDLRLDVGRVRPQGRPLAQLGVMLAVVLGLLLAGLLIQRAGPGHPLRPLQIPLRSLRLAVTLTPGGRNDVLLDDGWRRVQELRDLAAGGRLGSTRLRDLLTEIESVYDEALRASAGEAREQRRAVTEASAAVTALGEVAAAAPPAVAEVVAAGQAALQARIARVGPIAGMPLPLPPASPTPTALAVLPTATATVAEPATAVPLPTTAVPLTPPPPPTPSPAPSPTAIPATPAPSSTPVAPPRREPRTPTPPPPTTTAVNTPLPVLVSPTPDVWPTHTPAPAPSEPPPGSGPGLTPLPPAAAP